MPQLPDAPADTPAPRRLLTIGVTQFVAAAFVPQHLVAGFGGAMPARGQEGIEGHQQAVARRPAGYRAEVPVTFTYDWEEYRLVVRGRIDGLTETEDTFEVEEIKTTWRPVAAIREEDYPIHRAQLLLYVYFLMVHHPGKRVVGKLTYLNLDDLSERSFPLEIPIEEGERFFTRLALAHLQAQRERDEWRRVRDASLARLQFPYPDRRPGQEELMAAVAQALEEERDLFVEAATGIGKTIAVLYPALRRLGQSERFTRIFFLTAKTAGKAILESTLRTAHARGLRLRTLFIEAKARACLSPGCQCHPDTCPYAQDYYAKAARVLPELLQHELMTAAVVRAYAERDRLCPFELSLDLALQADLIVCDYNYVFDPRVYLRRFFAPGSPPDHLFLVDEAHNLVPRGREMYSATLGQQQLTELAAAAWAADPELSQACADVAAFLEEWQRELRETGQSALRLTALPEMLPPAVARLLERASAFLATNAPSMLWDQVQELFFTLTAYARVAALLSEEYALYVKMEAGWAVLHLFCLNPGPLLRRRLDGARCTVFFSATLSPHEYFRELLGGSPEALSLRLPSPFPPENRLYLHVPGIDTRYRAREKSAHAVARCAEALVAAHPGNYILFFPSYAYLNAVRPLVKDLLAGRASVYTQRPAMTEAEKRDFLRKVTATGTGRSRVGLAVLGGLFGEGIDLPGEQLVGVLIVGPGLPVVNEEQELIRGYFEARCGEGFRFAYLIPGLIRVIQSAGRVFRTPTDRGVVLLVDDRFATEPYRDLLPPDWFPSGAGLACADYAEVLAEFWGDDGAGPRGQ
ncbi:MAG: hypothetical protein GX774_07015 [Armatimonadetes bacterium]|nr:hypothetical protein [Armatimonadota bacterium]